MKRQLYNLLIPKSIRENIYRANVHQFEESEIKRLNSFDESLPHAELSAVYIANLRVLTDRNAFLNAMKKDSCVAEIGVRDGIFSEKILSITKPERLHLLDTWPDINSHEGSAEQRINIIENKFRGEIAVGQVAIHPGEPLAELQGFKEDYLDWIYIDNGHSYDNVAMLLELCRIKLKSGGIIAGRNYVSGYIPTRERYGVIEAINTFCKNNDWELIYLTNESHRNLSYAIQKMVR
jgi:hypothetical protein